MRVRSRSFTTPEPRKCRAWLALWAGLLTFVGLSSPPALQAQIPDPPDNFVTEENSTGVAPFGAYEGIRENVNLNNLNLNLVIPLFTLPGRNGLDVTVSAHYNAIQREWMERELMGVTTCQLVPFSEAGAENFDIQLAPSLSYEEGELDPTSPFPRRHRYVLREADGTRHELRLRDNDADSYNQSVWSLPGRFRSTGSSHISLQENAAASDPTVSLRDGTQILFDAISGGRGTMQAQYIQDSNGNRIQFQWVSGQVDKVIDTLGREVKQTLTIVMGEITERLIEVEAVVTGTAQTLMYRLKQIDNLNQELTLPSGLKYAFQWADVGTFTDPCDATQSRTDRRLIRIDYPSGGSTRYDWTVPALPNNTLTLLSAKHRCDQSDGTCTAQEEATTTYSKDFPGGFTQVTRPDGSYTRHFFDNQNGQLEEVKEVQIEFYDSSDQLLRTADRVWDDQGMDPRVIENKETLHVTAGPDKVRKNTLVYDNSGYDRPFPEPDLTTGNVIQQEEFDWGDNQTGALLRKTERTYLIGASYDVESAQHILDRLTSEKIFDGLGNLVAETNIFYDEGSRINLSPAPFNHDSGYGTGFSLRGNPTRVARKLLSAGRDLETTRVYDIAGNVRESRDPKDNLTKMVYSQTTEYAYPDEIDDPKNFKTQFLYDYDRVQREGFGRLIQRKDANLNDTDFEYDKLGRTKQIDFPDGGQARFHYSDLEAGTGPFAGQAQLPLRLKKFTKIDDGPLLEMEDHTITDGFGRTVLQGVRNGTLMDWTETRYDGNERVSQTSNPLSITYTSGVPSPNVTAFTTIAYDGIDRVLSVTTPDTQSVTTTYTGNKTTVTDQADAARRTESDGLDRIGRVWEADLDDPGCPPCPINEGNPDTETEYLYDALDNLIEVLQGEQVRSFHYDSLSRLIVETHPESGATFYQYDDNSNLTARRDARGKRSDNTYDELDRVLSTQYSDLNNRSDTTPSVSYLYDTATNGKGRLAQATDGAGRSTFQYDELGRVTSLKRIALEGTSEEKTLTANYTYNLTGGITQAVYPETTCGTSPPDPMGNWTIDHSYDDQGRQTKVVGSSDCDSPATLIDGYSFVYAQSTATETTQFVLNSSEEIISYNDRLQPVTRLARKTNLSQTFLNLEYDFNSPFLSDNNGNVQKIEDKLDASKTLEYNYDALNRISGVAGAEPIDWTITYAYDRYGNRFQSSEAFGNAPNYIETFFSIDARTNRITNAGFLYDSAGNLLDDNSKTYQWDAENRLESVDDGTTAVYEYDYQGRRVVKRAPGDDRLYFYDLTGKVLWEFPIAQGGSNNQDLLRLFLNGKIVFENSPAGLDLFHLDHLGTVRAKVDPITGAVTSDTYYPFGQRVNTVSDLHVKRFTGKERDVETGLDYFGARYCDSVMGRFTSVDPALESADTNDPQTWNRYVYVRNNPLRFVDPDGRIIVPINTKRLEENKKLVESINAAIDAAPCSVCKVAPVKFLTKLFVGALIPTKVEDLVPELPFPGVGVAGRGSTVIKSAVGKIRTGLGNLLNASKFDRILKSKGNALQFSNNSSAGSSFGKLRQQLGVTADEVVDRGDGVFTFRKGNRTFTLRKSTETGVSTISVKTKNNKQQIIVRFSGE